MMTIRKSAHRGSANYGWLQAKYSFSFSDYYDPQFMGFSVLRVINEDRVSANSGFPTHGHRDMEIITYLLEGVLEHKDNLGHSEQLHPGEIQTMTAGKGILHSEFNPSNEKPTHLLQIWIETNQRNHQPRYQQKNFAKLLDQSSQLVLLVSPDGRDESLPINQNILLYGMKHSHAGHANYTLANGRKAWLQVAKGMVDINSIMMEAGDGIAVEAEQVLQLNWQENSEFLLFDLP